MIQVLLLTLILADLALLGAGFASSFVAGTIYGGVYVVIGFVSLVLVWQLQTATARRDQAAISLALLISLPLQWLTAVTVWPHGLDVLPWIVAIDRWPSGMREFFLFLFVFIALHGVRLACDLAVDPARRLLFGNACCLPALVLASIMWPVDTNHLLLNSGILALQIDAPSLLSRATAMPWLVWIVNVCCLTLVVCLLALVLIVLVSRALKRAWRRFVEKYCWWRATLEAVIEHKGIGAEWGDQ